MALQDWEPTADWINIVKGATTMPGWLKANQLIIPCHLGQHYVLCRVTLKTGIIDLYDPIFFRFRTQDEKQRRFNQMLPLCILLPKLLAFSGFYDDKQSKDFLEVNLRGRYVCNAAPDDDQFIQNDDHSCGPALYARGEAIDWFPKYTLGI